MAMFTMTVKELVDKEIDLFDFSYPIFDETYRAALEEKIINHFYFREIGVETVGRFLFNLKTRMNEIMPFFNKMYAVQKMDQRIMDNYDVLESYTRTTTDSGNATNVTNGTENGTTTAKKLFSDTPQGRTELAGTEFVTEINDDAATDETTTTETGTTTTGATGHDNWTRTMTGNIGVQTDADAVIKYMSSLVNVDLEVFKALADLFMQVY